MRCYKNIGLYRTKARNILATCKLLILCHGSQVPRTKDHLESLPGVGRKTANVILNTVFNLPVIAVDTHVFRVANRTGIAVGKNVLEVEIKLIKFIPKEFHQNAHHWLILHGRYVCKAGKPECALCSINDLCDYKRNILKIIILLHHSNLRCSIFPDARHANFSLILGENIVIKKISPAWRVSHSR